MSNKIDNPELNDNRKYHYGAERYDRHEFEVIQRWIPEGARIIDLGCGNGALMHTLEKNKKVIAEGIEIAESGVEQCVKSGLAVRQASIDDVSTYSECQDNQFDYAICNVTLQMVNYPEVLLSEMKRIAKYQIISIPNFAYITNRFDLLLCGVMPRPLLHGYTWYNTGHIHQSSLKDFKRLCASRGMTIVKREDFGFFSRIFYGVLPNLLSKESIFLLEER